MQGNEIFEEGDKIEKKKGSNEEMRGWTVTTMTVAALSEAAASLSSLRFFRNQISVLA